MRSLFRSAVIAAAAAGILFCGCGKGGKAPPLEERQEEDLLGSRSFPGEPVRIFIAAKRAFEALGIEQTSARPDEALSGSIPPKNPGDASILVNLTFEGRGRSTIVRAVIYNVRAGAGAKARLKEKLFDTMDKRLKKFAPVE